MQKEKDEEAEEEEDEEEDKEDAHFRCCRHEGGCRSCAGRVSESLCRSCWV